MATKTVGPGKDYATLAAWAIGQAASAGAGILQIAQCYSGADLGGLSIGFGWNAASTTIIAVDMHNGTDAGHSGVAYSGSDWVISTVFLTNFTVRGMRLEGSVIFDGSGGFTQTGTIVEKCLFVPTAAITIPLVLALDTGSASLITVEVRNNIILKHAAGASDGILLLGIVEDVPESGILEMDVSLYNNTIICGTIAADSSYGIHVITDSRVGPGYLSLNADIQNNISMGHDIADIGLSIGDETPSINAAYNYTSDTSANDIGGGFSLVNQSITSTVVNRETNPYLKTGANAIDAGTTIGTFPDDVVGTIRPQGLAWDIGAFEYIPILVTPSGGGGNIWSHHYYR